jgi:DNA polymerase-3 subunit epsilon
MRQVVLDTETTGLEPEAGHRIIEIGCVELVNRRLTGERFHCYVNPGRGVEAGAEAVHGLDDEFLADKPSFGDVAAAFVEFVRGAELVIHNADFDVGFLNSELKRVGDITNDIRSECGVLDTLKLARQMHPGQRNSLDALCKRYTVDNSRRELHGALLDAEILASVYLVMTGGQASLSLGQSEQTGAGGSVEAAAKIQRPTAELVVRLANAHELSAHDIFLDRMAKQAQSKSLWRKLEEPETPAQVA